MPLAGCRGRAVQLTRCPHQNGNCPVGRAALVFSVAETDVDALNHILDRVIEDAHIGRIAAPMTIP